MGLIKKEFISVDNIQKFALLQEQISKKRRFSISDFALIFNSDDEAIYYFIDEYDFKEVKKGTEKYNLCVSYLKKNINNVDPYIFTDLLFLSQKIGYYEILDDIILHSSESTTKIISILNFIEDNWEIFKDNYRVNEILNILYADKDISNLCKFEILVIKAIEDNTMRKALENFYQLHKNEKSIKLRIKYNIEFYRKYIPFLKL